MSVYVIAQVNIHDADKYALYVKGFIAMFADYRGAVVVADDKVEVIEGAWPYARTAVIRFDDDAEARRWYHSEAYQVAAAHRFGSATTNLIIARGLD